MQRWVMLFNQVTIKAAISRAPWGPWDKVVLDVFDAARDGALSVYMHVPFKDLLGPDPFGGGDAGVAYGPYLLTRFTRWDRWRRVATLTYLMSTHVPYQVQLMKFRITCQ